MHTSSNLKVNRVFTVDLGHMKEAFEERIAGDKDAQKPWEHLMLCTLAQQCNKKTVLV